MGFDVSKWNKQRYLAEAGITQEVEIDALHDLLYNADPSYSNLAKAIAKFLKGTEEDTNSGFSKDQTNDFMKILHTELGMEPLNEEAKESTLEKIASELKLKYPELRFDPTSDRIDVFGDENDKVTFANAERKTKFEDGYRMFDVEDDDRGYMVRIVKNK